MDRFMQGKVYKFGDNIDTDILAPAMTSSFGLVDESEFEDVKTHAFEQLRPDFYKEVVPGSILVAGRNFGFGSHREHATAVLAHLGFQAVLADSVARLFLRNSIAIGYPVLQVPGITDLVEEGDEISLDLSRWEAVNLSTGEKLPIEPFSEVVLHIFETKGIIEYMVCRLQSEPGTSPATD